MPGDYKRRVIMRTAYTSRPACFTCYIHLLTVSITQPSILFPFLALFPASNSVTIAPVEPLPNPPYSYREVLECEEGSIEHDYEI